MQMRIESRKNPLLQQVRKLLSSKSQRQQAGLFAGEGTKLLQEAIRYCDGLDTVLLADGVEVPDIPEGVDVYRVKPDILASVSTQDSPQGAIFLCRIPKNPTFLPQKGMLLLDGIQDPGNVGTILRTADALDIPVALLEGCADVYNPKTIRSTMGAAFRMPVVSTTWEEARTSLEQAGIPVAVMALSNQAVDLRTAQVGQMALVIGSEGRGVRPEILEQARHQLIIPMNPHCESLNAAVAAAICMWQIKLQG